MKEYIEREAALEKVIEVKHHDPELSGVVLHRYIKEIDLKDIPAAAVVEVRHGQWIRKEDDSCYWYECSECGEKLAKTQWGNDYFSAYCPNCGTLMDKEEANE